MKEVDRLCGSFIVVPSVEMFAEPDAVDSNA